MFRSTRHDRNRCVGGLCALALVVASTPVMAGQVWLPGASGGSFRVDVQSIQARRFARTVHQRYDYSCGAAAISTLLTYQYGDTVSEMDIFKYMWEHGDKDKIRHKGFSLLDMKNYLDAHGYEANGYVAPLSKLKKVGIPAIVLVSEHGYNHFVVIKGIAYKRVLLGDPSFGARTMSLQAFHKIMLSPILFVVINHATQAVFNGNLDWSLQPDAPLSTALSPDKLAVLNLSLPGTGTF